MRFGCRTIGALCMASGAVDSGDAEKVCVHGAGNGAFRSVTTAVAVPGSMPIGVCHGGSACGPWLVGAHQDGTVAAARSWCNDWTGDVINNISQTAGTS